jgi:hypothetical protein
MNPQASSSSQPTSHRTSTSHPSGIDPGHGLEHEHPVDSSGRRHRKRRPRTWARRMKQKFMPLFWVLIGLIGLVFVVKVVLSMTALK